MDHLETMKAAAKSVDDAGVAMGRLGVYINPPPALLPCPFCGCTKIDCRFWFGTTGEHGPGCTQCGALAETVERWNRRTPAPMSIVDPIRQSLLQNED